MDRGYIHILYNSMLGEDSATAKWFSLLFFVHSLF